MLIVGDDVTDEDMFLAAPDGAVTVHVGSGPTAARMRLVGPDQVRKLLTELAERLDLRIHPDHSEAFGKDDQSAAESQTGAVEATPGGTESAS